jgi:hypothetical protein
VCVEHEHWAKGSRAIQALLPLPGRRCSLIFRG